MRRLVVLLCLAFLSASQPTCLKLDVVLVGDYSDSVSGNEQFVVASFRAFADKLEIDEDQVRLGVVLFGDQATLSCPLTGDRSLITRSLVRLVGQKANEGSTDLTSGLVMASAMLLADRPEARKLIVLVSDGLHNNQDRDPAQVVELLKLQQILIAPIMIVSGGGEYGVNHGHYLMEQLASPGLYHEAAYEELIGVLKAMDVCL